MIIQYTILQLQEPTQKDSGKVRGSSRLFEKHTAYERSRMDTASMEERALVVAARGGHLDELKELLERGVDLLGTIDPQKDTALHAAAAAGQVEVVRFLLAEDDDGLLINAKNHEEKRAVDLAASNHHVDVLKVFAEHGDEGMTQLRAALVRASRRGDIQRVELLLDVGVDANAADMYSALYVAAEEGHLAAVKKLLEYGADPNLKARYMIASCLHAAAQSGNVEIVKLLLVHKAEVNALDQAQCTPLHHAAESGYADIINALLAHGADVNAINEYGHSPLYEACHSGCIDTVTSLLKCGAATDDVHESPMNGAACSGSVQILELLCAHGLSANANSIDTKTPLHCACENGQTEAMKWLLNRGADANAVDLSGRTPLHYAARHGHSNIVKVLLTYDVQVNARDAYEGKTALHEVCIAYPEAPEVALMLLAYGSDSNLPDLYGRTPLRLACEAENGEIVSALLEYVMDVDVVAHDGSAALYYACRGDIPIHIIHTLLDRGADPLRPDFCEQTILNAACRHRNADLVKRILDRGVNPNALGWVKQTALHHAVAQNCSEIVELLFQHGANTQLVDNWRRTALDDACRLDYIDLNVVKVFLEYEPFSDKKEEYFNRALGEACKVGRIETVLLLMEHGAKPTYGALKAACFGGHFELVQMMLAPNVDPNKSADTPLHLASRYNHADIVKLLLANGANIQVRNSNNRTPLHEACECNADKAVVVLLEHGVNIDAQDKNGRTALHLAVPLGHISCVRLLLKYGADVTIEDTSGWTAMGIACRQNQSRVVKAIVSNGAYVDICRAGTMTLLHIAASSQSHACIPHLIKHGADVHARDESGYTPLARCLRPQFSSWTLEMAYKTAYVLVKHGAIDLGAPDDEVDNQLGLVQYIIQWWLDERQQGKPLSSVPVDVLERGQVATEGYLTKLRAREAK